MATFPYNVSTAIIYDRSEHYYAIGNTPPQQFIPPNNPNPQILCLASGDLRSCFFSISRTNMSSYESVSFVVNDKNSAIVARNVLLLVLSLGQEEFDCTSQDLWAVWYEFLLSQSQWNCARKVLQALLGENKRLLQDYQISIEPNTLQKCKIVWKTWLDMDMPVGKAKALRDDYKKSRPQSSQEDSMHTSFVRQSYLGGAFINHGDVSVLPGLHVDGEELHSLCGTYAEKYKDFSGTGPSVVNKTLFMDPERYNLHYASEFYQSFHLWKFRPSDGETLESYCKSQHAEWVRDFCLSSKKIKFEFVQGDCLSLCLTNNSLWHQRFNVIDTSNVCDHIGLAGLLLTCRPLITPNGVMFTTSMTAHKESDSDLQCLNKELICEPAKWMRLYGWRCHGHDPTVKSIDIEWPLVSKHAPFHFQWTPSTADNDVLEEDVLTVTMSLLDPYYAGKLSFYSAGIVIMFLTFRSALPGLEFLAKYKDEIPKTSFLELQLWLSHMALNTIDSIWIEIDLTEKEEMLKQVIIRQPWLRAQGLLHGEMVHFSILLIDTSTTGKTLSVKFLAPAEISLSSIKLIDFNGVNDVFDVKRDEISTKPFVLAKSLLGLLWAGKVPESSRQYSVKGLKDWTFHAKMEGQSYFTGHRANHILRIATSQMLTKPEMLATRSVIRGVSDTDPLLSVKELVMSLVGGGKNRDVVAIEDGAGTVPLVIIMEGIYQDETSGTPLLDLIVFAPDRPFSSAKLPRELKNRHLENLQTSRTVLSWNTRKNVRTLVETLAGDFAQTQNFGPCKGEMRRLLFPALFPMRSVKFNELQYEVTLNAKLGTLRLPNDHALEKMVLLKDNGNSLLREKRFDEAIFSYTLAALKLESEGVDDTNHQIREIAAQCHCNMALAKLTLSTDDALLEAVRSCSFAIQLMPTWGKPYYRRGICYEKQGLNKLALKDLKVAQRYYPTDSQIRDALLRVRKLMKNK